MSSSSKIQSVLFDRNFYTSKSARAFLKKHKLKPIKRQHKTQNFLRYRIQNPDKFKRFITKSVKKNTIKFVIGFY